MSIGSPACSWLVCLASLASGLLGGMLGMAAGIFIVPALTLAFGLDIRHPVGASLVALLLRPVGSFFHHRADSMPAPPGIRPVLHRTASERRIGMVDVTVVQRYDD